MHNYWENINMITDSMQILVITSNLFGEMIIQRKIAKNLTLSWSFEIDFNKLYCVKMIENHLK